MGATGAISKAFWVFAGPQPGQHHLFSILCGPPSLAEKIYFCPSPRALLEFSFRQGGGTPPPWTPSLGRGTPPSWTPSPPPLEPLPPSPLRSNSPENQGFGNVFSFGSIFSSRAFSAPLAGFFGHSTVSFLPSVADTMSQRPICAFFSTPVQQCPRAKCDDVVNTILYFRFQDRWTGKKRQEAYNVAQKACSTLFLNSP